MSYTVKLLRPAQKTLDRLTGDTYRRMMAKLLTLEQEPRPHGIEKLAGEGNLYRIRTGDWRIIYQIIDRELLVLVLKIGNRRDVYREL